MYPVIETKKKALLVFESPANQDAREKAASLIKQNELKSLTAAIGLEVIETKSFRVASPNSATFLGKGQTTLLHTIVQAKKIDVVVFDVPITPRIQRNLEERLGTCVVDRQEVIIQIFADRAKTAEAKLQAELAVLRYSLPRLTHKRTALSQQRGGAFRSRGAGETKLELNKRLARERIALLTERLSKVRQHRSTQRKSRTNANIPVGSIVGYTNSGKSSLLKLLSKQNVAVEDKLFATLDSQTKKVFVPPYGSLVLTDTVGFVSNLPHDLIDAFRSTLEEVCYSDFLIIVCDASHPAMLDCLQVTLDVLQSLGCGEKRQIIFVNKMDAVYDSGAVALLQQKHPASILGSVKEKKGISDLRAVLKTML